MKQTYRKMLLVLTAAALLVPCASAQQSVQFPQECYIGGFLIGPQAYTFNRFSFFEAVDKAKQAGAHVIEAYPGQRLSPEDNRQFNHDAPPDVWAKAKMKLRSAGIRLVNYGVVGLGSTEESMRKVFDFATIMDIPCITTEPGDEKDFDLIEKLVKEYNIKIAIHNHPKPSRYWDPHYVLKCVKGRDPRIGACADTGHWMRSGVHPLEALKILEGRIISSHLKDLNEFGTKKAHDVHYGQGKGNIKAILDEYKRQGFKGNISVEYEYNWENNVGDVAACIDYVRKYGKK